MFHSARVKLTGWYLLIIMIISVSFSIAIYRVLASELDRVERMQRLRIERLLPGRIEIFPSPFLDPDLVVETKNRLKVVLALIDLGILGASAGAGYFLAGRTLKPIKEMVDDQRQFIADASHELRTPITSLKSEIEVSLRERKLTLNEAKKLLLSNLEEANNLQALSDNLIKLTQYQKGNNGLQVARFSLSSMTEEAVRKVVVTAKKQQIEIENRVKNGMIEGNRLALVELMVIFLDNAVKYSPKGSKVVLSAEKVDNHFLIHVKDQGMGIDLKDIPHLFDRFYRADKSRDKSDVSGYGLGLSIAKQIIDSHKGSVKVQSKVNQGTTFTVQLPIKQSREQISFSKSFLSLFL